MNPLRISGQGYGRFDRFDVAIDEGCTALVGPNGSGKSRLLNSIELALFADGARDLALWLAPNADRLEIELEFEHDRQTYRVRRGYRQTAGGAGKVTLDLERFLDSDPEDNWETLTRETTGATQQLIVDTIGLSRRTFNAAAFLAQGNAAAFPDASPSERKAMLGEILDPRSLWPALAALAKTDCLEAANKISADRTRIEERETLLGRLPAVEDELAARREGVTLAEETIAIAEGQLEEAQAELAANAASADRVRAAKAEWDTARGAWNLAAVAVREAEAAETEIPGTRAKLAEVEGLAAGVTLLEQKLENQRNARTAALAAEAQLSGHLREADQIEAERRRHGVDLSVLAERHRARTAALADIQHAPEGEAHCDRCQQTLADQARATVIESLTDEITRIALELAEKTHLMESTGTSAAAARTAAAKIVVPEVPEGDFERDLVSARSSVEIKPKLELILETQEALAAQLPSHRSTLAATAAENDAKAAAHAQASENVKDTDQLTWNVSQRRDTVATRRTALDQARAEVVRLEEQHARLTTAKTELEELRRSTAVRQTEVDLLKLAERAFGRDGIPVLLVENIIPQIESEANRILDQLPTVDGDTFRLELRTQREQKTTDNLRETLDIVVYDRDGSRPYETYSGGERARLNIALRIALARLLANRRGAESRLLAIDELEYLDELGQEKLVDVIRSVAGDFDRVVVVSHSPNVRDAFANVIQIVKDDGVSRVAGAVDREPVPA